MVVVITSNGCGYKHEMVVVMNMKWLQSWKWNGC